MLIENTYVELCLSILNHPLICMRDNCYGKAYIVYYIIVSLTREVLPHKMNGYLTSYISYLMVLMRGNQLSFWYSTILFFHVPFSLLLMSLLKLNGMSNDSFIDSLILMLCTVCSNRNYYFDTWNISCNINTLFNSTISISSNYLVIQCRYIIESFLPLISSNNCSVYHKSK